MSALSTPNPHPLAQRLIERYRADGLTGPVLEIAAGSGRNTRALVEARIPVTSTRDDDPYTQLPGGRNDYDAALSTHGFLHGTTAKLRAGIAELRRVLRPDGRAYLTLGSFNDPRFGFGLALDERTFAPGDGPETGIPHAYFERDGIAELLRGFAIESLEEVDATEIVGTWAHPELDPAIEERGSAPEAPNATDSLEDSRERIPQRILHWFVVARKL